MSKHDSDEPPQLKRCMEYSDVGNAVDTDFSLNYSDLEL